VLEVKREVCSVLCGAGARNPRFLPTMLGQAIGKKLGWEERGALRKVKSGCWVGCG